MRLRPWMLVSAVWLAPAVLATVNHVVQRRLEGQPPGSAEELIFAGGDWLVYAVLVPPVFAVARRWPIARPHIAQRALLHLLFALGFCVAWATSGKILQAALGFIFKRAEVEAQLAKVGDHFWQQLGLDWLSWVFTTLPFGVVVYLSIVGIAHAIRYFTESTDREVQLARLSEQLAGARFSALQAQLNPHFLFNTLNTIAVRARDGDGPGTARMVEQLSDILRRTLSRDRANEVKLAEELDLVRQYLGIEQARFSDRLTPEFQVDPAVESALVPSFALQHLVENAIRHGIARRSDAGRLRVTARRLGDVLEISVADDGPGIVEGATSPGHGIENTRERLRSLYGDRGSLEVARGDRGGTTAMLRVPYRRGAETTNGAN
jgi:two-component system LytT family sensor kinase